MRFPHRARSRRPNPEPASLITPVVSSSARLLRIDPKCFPRSMGILPRLFEKRLFFFPRAFLSRVYARKPCQPFKSRRALSRLKEDAHGISCLSLGPRKRLGRGSRRARRARASLHTRTSATHERPRHDVSLATRLVCTSRRHVRRRTVRARVFPSSPRPREDHAEALGVDERGRVRRARVPGGRRGGLRRRAVAQRAGRDVLPLRLRGGAAVRVRAAPASRRGRFARARTVVASETNGFSDTLSPRDDATL